MQELSNAVDSFIELGTTLLDKCLGNIAAYAFDRYPLHQYRTETNFKTLTQRRHCVYLFRGCHRCVPPLF